MDSEVLLASSIDGQRPLSVAKLQIRPLPPTRYVRWSDGLAQPSRLAVGYNSSVAVLTTIEESF